MEVAYRLSQEEERGGGKKTEKLVFCWGLLMRSAVVGVALLGPPSHRPNEEGSLWDLPGRLGARGKGEEEGATEMDASLSCSPNLSRPFIRM